MTRANVARGVWGEDRAVAHFVRDGYAVLFRNWRPHGVGLRGDLDLIVERDGVVVVVEVKARRAGSPGGAVAAVTPAKQEQIRRLTERWLAEQGDPDVALRFDVVTIDGVQLRHWEHAF